MSTETAMHNNDPNDKDVFEMIRTELRLEEESHDDKAAQVRGGTSDGDESESSSITGSLTLDDDIDDAKQKAKAERKALKKAKKAARRAQREGRGDPTVGQKPCDMCGKSVNLLIRCTYDATGEWKMVCGKCWNVASGGVVDGDANHPYYRYGGLWKNRKAR